jgi:hypothetical protein
MTQQPPTLPHQVRLVESTDNPMDAQATKALLNYTRTSTGYKCPNCQYITDIPNDMIAHLANEINKSLQEINAFVANNIPANPKE